MAVLHREDAVQATSSGDFPEESAKDVCTSLVPPFPSDQQKPRKVILAHTMAPHVHGRHGE